jgi:hypothetical protein
VSECLLHQGQVDVADDEMRRQGVLKNVWIPFLCQQARGLRDRLEQSEELAPVKPAAFLANEEKIRT